MPEAAAISRICLEGNWSMGGVAERFSSLSGVVSSLLASQTVSEADQPKDLVIPEIDLSGITDFDACGCQLLALFVRKLGQLGISAQLTNIPDELRSKVYVFGFERELNLSL